MDDSLIAPYERLAASRAEMAAAEGISVRTLQRRLAAARERVARAGFDALPLVVLVDHEWPRREHYDTDTQHHGVGGDRLEGPGGLFRIGTHFGRGAQVQHAGNGQPLAQVKPKPKPEPSKPKPRMTRAEVDQIVGAIMAKGRRRKK